MSKKNLQDWVMNRYKLLWNEFHANEFTGEEASAFFRKAGEEIQKIDVRGIGEFFSELRSAGLLEVKFDPEDSRKRIYMLKSEQEALGEWLSTLSRSDIESILKKAADLIRTRVDYKFILILLFLKRISDKWELEFDKAYKEALKDGFSETDAKKEAKNATYHDFVIPEEYLWENIRKDVSTLPETFSKALKVLAEKNSELKDILDNADFIQFTNNKENAEILRQLVELFSEKKLHHVAPDILGDAYEWVLRYFAPQKAKEGEVYTPREVIQLLVEILNPKPGQSVYDPASASNGMLIIAYQYVEEKDGKKEAEKLFLYGQEANHKTLAFGRMNLYMHDIRNAQLAFGDTLLYPKFKEQDKVNQFDIVIANPPWNQDGYDEAVIKKGEFWKQRFPFGFTTGQSADWMWIQHMLTSASNKDGRVGIVIDNGCLFRSGAERSIRVQCIEKDLIECMILLPEKLFYNTGAPGAIMLLNKNKSTKSKGKILFINASLEYDRHPDVRKLNILKKENIDKIVNVCKAFKEDDSFSRIVNIDQIKANDYNLSVPFYVYPKGIDKVVDVLKEYKELSDINVAINGADEKIERYIRELDSFKTDMSKWKEVTIKDMGRVFTGKTPPTKIPKYWKGKCPFVTPTDISEDIYVTKTERYVTDDGAKQATLIPKNSVMVTCIASIGEIALASEECITNQQINSIICNEEINPLFVYYYIKFNKDVLKRWAGITTSPIIKKSTFEKFPILMPPLPGQDKIAEILGSIDKELLLQKQKKHKLEVLKQGIMNNLLNNKI